MDNKYQSIVTKSRKTGLTHAMVQYIKYTIENDGTAGVAGCKDPSDILKRLSSLGVEVEAEPMIATQPMKTIFDNHGEPVGIEFGGKKLTGFVFSMKKGTK